MSEGRPDRYEPLPGLFGMPGFLYRKLGARGRRIAIVVGGIALAGVVVAAIVLIPQIRETKRDNAARDRREAAAAARAERRRLIIEQRPHRAVSGLAPATTPSAGAPCWTSSRPHIVRDARARVRAGLLESAATALRHLRADSRRAHRRALSRLSCTAVTSEVRGAGGARGVVGHPFRAMVDYRSGRYAWCKVSGRAGEGSYLRLTKVLLPRACGG